MVRSVGRWAAVVLALAHTGGGDSGAGLLATSSSSLADFVVVVDEGAAGGTRFAAAELANLVGNLTDPEWRDINVSSSGRLVSQGRVGRPLRTTTNLTSAQHSPRMLVGWGAVSAANKTDPSIGYPGLLNDSASLGNDGFLLWTGHAAGGAPFVAFTGSPDGKRGTLNAVYEFVEMLGIRFVAFDETTYPSATPVLTAPTFARIMEPQPQVHWRGMEDWPSFNHRIFSRRVRYVISGSGSGCPEGQIHTPLCEALYPPIYSKPANNSAGCARPRTTLTLPL